MGASIPVCHTAAYPTKGESAFCYISFVIIFLIIGNISEKYIKKNKKNKKTGWYRSNMIHKQILNKSRI